MSNEEMTLTRAKGIVARDVADHIRKEELALAEERIARRMTEEAKAALRRIEETQRLAEIVATPFNGEPDLDLYHRLMKITTSVTPEELVRVCLEMPGTFVRGLAPGNEGWLESMDQLNTLLDQLRPGLEKELGERPFVHRGFTNPPRTVQDLIRICRGRVSAFLQGRMGAENTARGIAGLLIIDLTRLERLLVERGMLELPHKEN